MPAALSSLPQLGIASPDRHAGGSSSARTPIQGFLYAAEALQPTGWVEWPRKRLTRLWADIL